MEAPERIILSQDKESGIINDYWVLHDYTITNNKIEYVRTDAFIEKAIGWIDYNNRNGGCFFDGWEKDFRKYMKGEQQ